MIILTIEGVDEGDEVDGLLQFDDQLRHVVSGRNEMNRSLQRSFIEWSQGKRDEIHEWMIMDNPNMMHGYSEKW